MAKQRKWTNEQLIIAIEESKNYTQVAKKLGLQFANTFLRNKIKMLGLNTSHFIKSNCKINVNDVMAIIETCYSKSQVLRTLGLSIYGANHRSLKRLIKRYKICTSHFTGKSTDLIIKNKRALIDLLIKDSDVESSSLKKRLLKAGLIINKCSICGIDKWLDKQLICHLDHINGIKNDNQIQNLRMLCPNCHSQTETYCGKNIKVFKRKIIDSSAIKNYKTKIKWPTNAELSVLVLKKPLTQLAKELGISDNAIRKRCKKLGIVWKQI